MIKHVEAEGTDLGRLEAIGALNFLDLDDVPVLEEGEPIDPRSIITLPMVGGWPVFPKFERSPNDPFLRRLDASGKKWVIFADKSQRPYLVLNAHHFLRDILFGKSMVIPKACWHRPIVITDMGAKIGDAIGRMKVKPEYPGDDIINHDLVLVWGIQKRIITGADLLSRLLRGIVSKERKTASMV